MPDQSPRDENVLPIAAPNSGSANRTKYASNGTASKMPGSGVTRCETSRQIEKIIVISISARLDPRHAGSVAEHVGSDAAKRRA